MLSKKLFQDICQKFSNRFPNHNYDTVTLDLMYKKLNYLKTTDLEEALNLYLININHGYFLPCPKVLIDFIRLKKPLPVKDLKIKPDCNKCYNDGFIRAKSRINNQKETHFKCDSCDRGINFKDLILWQDSFLKNFLPEYKYWENKEVKNDAKIKSLIEMCQGKGVKGKLPAEIKTIGESIKKGLEKIQVKKKNML